MNAAQTPHPIRSARPALDLLFTAILTLAMLAGAIASGQTPAYTPDQQQFQQGKQFFEARRYAEAALAFEQLKADFPESPLIPNATFNAASCYFSFGAEEKGMAALRRNLSDSNVPGYIVESSINLLARRLQAKAQRYDLQDPLRDATLQMAIAEYDNLLLTFPDSPAIEQVNLGKAQCYYQMHEYETAALALVGNAQKLSLAASKETYEFYARIVAAQYEEANPPNKPNAAGIASAMPANATVVPAATVEHGKEESLASMLRSTSLAYLTNHKWFWWCVALTPAAITISGVTFLYLRLRRRNGRGLGRRRKGTYHAFYFNMLLEETGRSPKSKSSNPTTTSGRESGELIAPSSKQGRLARTRGWIQRREEIDTTLIPTKDRNHFNQSVVSANTALIAEQRNLIEKQRLLVAEQLKLIDENRRRLLV